MPAHQPLASAPVGVLAAGGPAPPGHRGELGGAAHALDAAFRTCSPLLAAYLPAGYPDPATSLDLLHQLAASADILEVGWPYTDPMMDGPVIQQAGAQALAAGFTVRHLMQTVRSLAPVTHVLVMGYYQPVYRYGLRRTADELAAAGAAGVILPDLNIDEAAPGSPKHAGWDCTRSSSSPPRPVTSDCAASRRPGAACSTPRPLPGSPVRPDP